MIGFHLSMNYRVVKTKVRCSWINSKNGSLYHQKLYDTSTAYGDGYAREVVYQVLVPIYAQLGFNNYFIEVFRHVVNFLAKWPLVTRRLLQQNSSESQWEGRSWY